MKRGSARIATLEPVTNRSVPSSCRFSWKVHAQVCCPASSSRISIPIFRFIFGGRANYTIRWTHNSGPGSIVSFTTERTEKRAVAGVEILTGLTDDRKTLKDAIDAVKTSNGTPYYDGLLDVAGKVFHDPPRDEFRGRRALVALTDGVDSTSASEFQEAKEDLQNGGITSYFIKVDTRPFFEENLLGDCEVATRFSQAQIRRYYRLFSNSSKMEKAGGFCQLGDFERLDVSKKLYELADTEMNELAKTSGGKVFPVGDLNEARNAFRSVANEIGTKYSVGYYPSNDKHDGTFRKITVELKGVAPGSLIRARDGYTAPTN